MSEGMATAFFFILTALLLSGTGELFLKRGVSQVGVLSFTRERIIAELAQVFSQPFILIGFLLIFSGAILWLAAISRVELSWAYPMLSLGYIYVLLVSWIFLGETMSPLRLLGILVIVSGVFLLFRS
ncbi:MAG: EamA family transporter [Chloroflexi bacterium]|nr:EamA family transporter [Chloroflexota bacterium]